MRAAAVLLLTPTALRCISGEETGTLNPFGSTPYQRHGIFQPVATIQSLSLCPIHVARHFLILTAPRSIKKNPPEPCTNTLFQRLGTSLLEPCKNPTRPKG